MVEPSELAGDRVRFGATVQVEDEQGAVRNYTLVGVDEADARAGLISYRSPLGRGLLGREEGDEALVDAPSGKRSLVVLSVSYPA